MNWPLVRTFSERVHIAIFKAKSYIDTPFVPHLPFMCSWMLLSRMTYSHHIFSRSFPCTFLFLLPTRSYGKQYVEFYVPCLLMLLCILRLIFSCCCSSQVGKYYVNRIRHERVNLKSNLQWQSRAEPKRSILNCFNCLKSRRIMIMFLSAVLGFAAMVCFRIISFWHFLITEQRRFWEDNVRKILIA